jgi:hypothetical protein
MDLRRRKFLKLAAVGLVAGGAPRPIYRRSPMNSRHGCLLTSDHLGRRQSGQYTSGESDDCDSRGKRRWHCAFPGGVYLCHSIRLKSYVTLRLEPGAVILAAPCCGYDAAESNAPFESYQDFGHNHWHNSLMWGEGISDVMICGPGLICGRGLRGQPPVAGPSALFLGVRHAMIRRAREGRRDLVMGSVCRPAKLAPSHVRKSLPIPLMPI